MGNQKLQAKYDKGKKRKKRLVNKTRERENKKKGGEVREKKGKKERRFHGSMATNVGIRRANTQTF